MNVGAIIGILSGLVVSASMWMPAYTRFGISVSFMDVPELSAFSWAIVFIGVILALMSVLNKMATNIIGIVCAGIGFLLSLLLLSIAVEDSGSAVGIGLYVLVIACIGSIIGNSVAMVIRKRQSTQSPSNDETVD